MKNNMKTKHFFLISPFVFIGMVLMITSSCKKENENQNNGVECFFNYDGKTFTLTEGILGNYGPTGEGSYELELWLYSGITFINADSVSGKGSWIGINLNSNAATLTPGNYSKVDGNYAPFTTRGAAFVTNWDSALEDQHYVYVKSGQVKVISVSSDQIEMSFDLVSTEDKSVSGYYKGKVLIY